MSENTITINGVEYVKATDAPPAPPYQIVVIEGGWNVVGNVNREADGSLTITEAWIIRCWGTTQGLGELAAYGPTAQTKLDPAGVVRVPAHATLFTMDSEASRW